MGVELESHSETSSVTGNTVWLLLSRPLGGSIICWLNKHAIQRLWIYCLQMTRHDTVIIWIAKPFSCFRLTFHLQVLAASNGDFYCEKENSIFDILKTTRILARLSIKFCEMWFSKSKFWQSLLAMLRITNVHQNFATLQGSKWA